MKKSSMKRNNQEIKITMTMEMMNEKLIQLIFESGAYEMCYTGIRITSQASQGCYSTSIHRSNAQCPMVYHKISNLGSKMMYVLVQSEDFHRLETQGRAR